MDNFLLGFAEEVPEANLADYNSDTVRRWVESNPAPTLQNNNIDIIAAASKPFIKNNLNNNTIDFEQTFWKRQKEEMPMLLQQPSHVLLTSHEADQPLDFTMSKFKTKTNTSVASQLKQFNNLASQHHMMLLQNNDVYYNRSNNNKSFTRGSSPSPSSSSEEEGVGPPEDSPRSPPSSPAPLRGDVVCPKIQQNRITLQFALVRTTTDERYGPSGRDLPSSYIFGSFVPSQANSDKLISQFFAAFRSQWTRSLKADSPYQNHYF
ncbi:hypothetical protein FQR65_LT09254 [Abscondita terminalis]|nr:hypothetical protein FQR65_LT09254 [Abscondita terminalis]